MHPLFHAKSLVKYFIHLVSFGNISICILDIYAPFLEILDPPLIGTITMRDIRKVRSGMGAYIGAARRRVHIAMVLLRPPSGHRPGRRQARHAMPPCPHPSDRTPPDATTNDDGGPTSWSSTTNTALQNILGGTLCRRSRHMPVKRT